MADLTEIFAVQLRRARHARRWTQEELAEQTGLSVRYIGQIERCKASPTISVLGKLADALGLDPGEMLRKANSSGGTKRLRG